MKSAEEILAQKGYIPSGGENGACPPTRSGSIHPLLGLKSA